MLDIAILFLKTAAGQWVNLCELLSIFFEVLGIFRMARRYTDMAAFFHRIGILFSALHRGKVAKGAATLGQRSPELALDVLQGLAFVALGFLLRAVPHVVALYDPKLVH